MMTPQPNVIYDSAIFQSKGLNTEAVRDKPPGLRYFVIIAT